MSKRSKANEVLRRRRRCRAGPTGSGMNAAEPAEIDIEDETAAWSKRLGRGTALAERGLQIRGEILGREMIDQSMAQTVADPFMAMFMEVTHEYCFGTVWARLGIERTQNAQHSRPGQQRIAGSDRRR